MPLGIILGFLDEEGGGTIDFLFAWRKQTKLLESNALVVSKTVANPGDDGGISKACVRL